MGVRAGDRERGEKCGHGRAHIRAEGHREGVVEEQQPGASERDEHRGGHRARLDEDRGERPDRHREQGVPAEDPVERRLGAPGGEPLERAHEEAERDHEERRRADREDRRPAFTPAREAGGGPLDRPGDDLDDALQRALVVEPGADEPESREGLGDHRGRAGQHAGRELDRQQHDHGEEVEHVVARRHREGAPELFALPEVAEGGEGVRDGRTDVRAHHHRDRALEGERRTRRRDEAHDQRAGDRGTLEQGRRQHPDEEAHEGVAGGLEEAIQESRPESLEPLAEPVDGPEEDDEERRDPEEPGSVPEEAVPGRTPRAHRVAGPASGREPTDTAPEFRFEMDE